jgi:hypothetical protein
MIYSCLFFSQVGDRVHKIRILSEVLDPTSLSPLLQVHESEWGYVLT